MIKISSDFSKAPGPRYRSEGSNSGEEFRERILLPALKEAVASKAILYIDLDDTFGYGTGFLEEAFGGLVRVEGYSRISDRLAFKSMEEPELIAEILSYMKDADEQNGTTSSW